MRRFSIRTLMAFILVSAVGLAALRNANDLWAGLMLMSALSAVGVAVLNVVILRGRERYWWVGFAVFGGGYLVAALSPIRTELATTQLLQYALSQASLPSVVVAKAPAADFRKPNGELDKTALDIYARDYGPGIPLIDTRNDAVIVLQEPATRWRAFLPGTANQDAFIRVGHSLLALLAGLVGGMVARWICARREREEARSVG